MGGHFMKVGKARTRLGIVGAVAVTAALAIPFTSFNSSASGAVKPHATPDATGSAVAKTFSASGHAVHAKVYTKPLKPTPAELQEIRRQNREDQADAPDLRGAQHQTPPTGPGTKAPGANPNVAPGDFMTLRSTLLPAGGLRSGVDEPSTANSGKYIFQTGNWYDAYSANNGTTWSYLDPFTIFGSGFCCDQVTLSDPAYNHTYWLLQYGNHLAIANSKNNDLANWCFYNITPANVGLPNGGFDYNRIAISTNNLYIATNTYDSSGTWATMIRLSLYQMNTCGSVGVGYYRTTSDFSWAPVQGAGDTMFWGSNSTTASGGSGNGFRIYRWPDTTNTINWDDRGIASYVYMATNTGNCASANGAVLNWCQRTDSRMSGTGVLESPSVANVGADNTTSVLSWAFNARQDGNHPFPYIRRVYFRTSDRAYLGSSEFFGTWAAHLYPDLAVDSRGHVGMACSYGGGTGTATYKPSGCYVLDDDVSPGQPWNYSFLPAGGGNACLNSDNLRRWGDYNSIRPWQPSGDLFIVTTFSLVSDAGSCGSTVNANVYNIVFGRRRDSGGYNRFKTT
jgi:hypothetical protein